MTKRKEILKTILFYLAVFLITTVCFYVFKPRYEFYGDGVLIQSITYLIITFIALYLWIQNKNGKMTTERWIGAICLLGYILRLSYMLYTPASVRQQDTFNRAGSGHFSYAWNIYSTGELPSTNDYQFYHPPLNAILQAGFMSLTANLQTFIDKVFFLNGTFPSCLSAGIPTYVSNGVPVYSEWQYALYSSCQILTVLYSVITLRVLVKIIKLFGFKDKTVIFLTLFVSLFPRHIQFAGMLNNDGLSYTFGILAIYYALKWERRGKSLLDILLTALFLGLGMMSKLSSATVCLPIAVIFIYEFIVEVAKKNNFKAVAVLSLKYVLFLCICAPIGLWFQVYAKIKFDQPFGFVFSNLNPALSTSNHSFISRFIVAFDKNEYFATVFCRPFTSSTGLSNNYNIINYCLRTSIFGEFTYSRGQSFALVGIVFGYITLAVLLIATIIRLVVFIQDKEYKNLKGEKLKEFLFILLLILSQIGSEVYFYIKMPYACTMDFRYLMPLILGLAIVYGKLHEYFENKERFKGIDKAIIISNGLFLITTTLFYLTCI